MLEFARAREMDFQVVHSHYWLSGWVGRRLGERWGIPWLHSAHTLARVKDRDRPQGAAPEAAHRIAVEDEIVRLCNRVISPTTQEVEDLASLYGAERGCIAVVPPGVDVDKFRRVDAGELRRKLGIGAEQRVVLFTGRLERLKGLDTLLRSIALLREQARPVRLLVVGDDSSNGILEAGQYPGERARMEALARKLGIEDAVDFLGAVPHDALPVYYSLADVCAVPSHSESFGLVAVESQACETPVVASRVGGLRQLVFDGVTGLGVAGHDPRDYAAALWQLLGDEPCDGSWGPPGASSRAPIRGARPGRAIARRLRVYGGRLQPDRLGSPGLIVCRST